MIAARVRPFLIQFEQCLTGQAVLLVTHAVTLRLVRALVENTVPEYPVEIARNGEIWQINFTRLGIRHDIHEMMLGSQAPRHRA